MIHELVHVYMIDWAANNSIGINNSLDFIMNLYFQNNQHTTIIYMVNQMGTALLDYYNSTFQAQIRSRLISQSYCELLIWGNLTGTSIYQSKAQADPAWDMQVKAIKTVEQHPDDAGKQMGGITLPFPTGGQPCQ